MQDRGESSAQSQPAGWGGGSYGQQESQQFPQPPRWDANAQYAAPAPSYGPPGAGPVAPAPAVKARPRWKTPLIAAVALVVGIVIGTAIGGSSKNDSSPSASGSTSTSSSAPTAAKSAAKSAAPAAPAALAASVVLQTSGNGQKTTKTFTVAANWSVKYTYNCASFGTQGNFVVMEHGNALDGLPIVNTSGNKGSDVSYQHSDGGQRSLEVNSECDWTLTVTSGEGG